MTKYGFIQTKGTPEEITLEKLQELKKMLDNAEIPTNNRYYLFYIEGDEYQLKTDDFGRFKCLKVNGKETTSEEHLNKIEEFLKQ